MKAVNYKVGVAKRVTKTGKKDFKPGDLISKMNAQKAKVLAKGKEKTPTKTRLAIMGLV